MDGSRGWRITSTPTTGGRIHTFPIGKRKSNLHKESKSLALNVIPSSLTSNRLVLKYTTPAILIFEGSV
ncbi:hypothetical protein LguiA_014965 [Lonicera macranthoides]